MNKTTLTVIALTAYFRKIQDIWHSIFTKLDRLKSESSELPIEADKLLLDLAVRYTVMFSLSWSPSNFFPAQNSKSLAVWQNENHSVAGKPQTSQQGATLKSCSHNIKADMAPLL